MTGTFGMQRRNGSSHGQPWYRLRIASQSLEHLEMAPPGKHLSTAVLQMSAHVGMGVMEVDGSSEAPGSSVVRPPHPQVEKATMSAAHAARVFAIFFIRDELPHSIELSIFALGSQFLSKKPHVYDVVHVAPIG